MTIFGNEAIMYAKEFEDRVSRGMRSSNVECVSKIEYEEFVEGHKQGSFLQSIYWSRVKEGWGCEPVVVRDEAGKIKAVMMVLIKSVPFLNLTYMYAPRGPVCDYTDETALKGLMVKVDELQRRYRGFALKTDPFIEEGDRVSIENMRKVGFDYLITKDGYSTIQCRSNYILDLEGKSCDEIYDGFHKKHRYNIRVAKRKGVECGFYGVERLRDFYSLMEETGARDGFHIRSIGYFERILKELRGKASLCMCYYQGKAVSGALVINYGGTMSYLYGASSSEHRDVMANYLMHWTIIKRCKELGCRAYDFMGIPYYYDKEHRNYGVYRFKKGFGGRVVNYAGEFEKVYYPMVGRLILKVMNMLGYKL